MLSCKHSRLTTLSQPTYGTRGVGIRNSEKHKSDRVQAREGRGAREKKKEGKRRALEFEFLQKVRSDRSTPLKGSIKAPREEFLHTATARSLEGRGQFAIGRMVEALARGRAPPLAPPQRRQRHHGPRSARPENRVTAASATRPAPNPPVRWDPLVMSQRWSKST